jgi:Outer membrane protein beta-barrel domain
MTKKGFLWLVVLLGFAIPGQAQFSLGVDAGGSINYLYTNSASQALTAYRLRGGVTFDIPLLYKVTDWLSVETEVSFIEKNYRIERTGFFQGVYQDNTNTYIGLPVLAHLSIGGQHLRAFLNLGFYGAYWILGRVKGTELNILDPANGSPASNVQPANSFDLYNPYHYDERYAFDNRKDQRMEFGWLAGTGMTYELRQYYQLFLECRYALSLTDQRKKYSIDEAPGYNETFSITTGIFFRLGGRRRIKHLGI